MRSCLYYETLAWVLSEMNTQPGLPGTFPVYPFCPCIVSNNSPSQKHFGLDSVYGQHSFENLMYYFSFVPNDT
jgi:hypothetical protein